MQHTPYFDTHAHFGPDPLATASAIERALHASVTRILAVGGSPDLNSSAIAATTAYPDHLQLALGFDRDQALKATPAIHLQTLRQLLTNHTPVAIGEIGLDLHYTPESESAQRDLFAAQLTLATEINLPVIIHTREADQATLDVLDETPWSGTGLRGVIHCYTGNRSFARQLLDRHFMVSFSGIVTFRNADMLRDSAAYIPDDRLLIETDSPYLAPVPKRGKTNEPAFLPHVATCLAQLRHTTPTHIATLTWQNAEKLFPASQPEKASVH